MYENGESVKDIALKLCTNRDYVTRQIKRIKENAETS
jgi:DNA-binding MarR family transcriptional regulator